MGPLQQAPAESSVATFTPGSLTVQLYPKWPHLQSPSAVVGRAEEGPAGGWRGLPTMSFRYPQPDNEDAFEFFCLRFLRHYWNRPGLQQYGKRGERQEGIDLIDLSGDKPLRGVQCKHH